MIQFWHNRVDLIGWPDRVDPKPKQIKHNKNMKTQKYFQQNGSNMKKMENTKNIQVETQQTQLSSQTRYQAIKGRVLFAIKYKSRIKCNLTWLSIKSHDFVRNEFWFKTKTLLLKPTKNMLLMHESLRLFTNNDIRTCRNQNWIKTSSKTNT